MEIIELIPYGEENAVKRKWLVRRCIENGRGDADSRDPDREMRKLIHKAREKYVILNNSDSKGYYRPTKKEYLNAKRYCRQEESRERSLKKSRKPVLRFLRQCEIEFQDTESGQTNFFDLIDSGG